MRPLHEPHKTKTVRRLSFPSPTTRRRALAQAHFNVFNLTQTQVTFDMSSLGTGAMSQAQVAGTYLGDEAYAGARNFESLQHSVREVLGKAYVCPTHNLLGSLKLVLATLLPEGKGMASNTRDHDDVLEPRGVVVSDVRDRATQVFTGDVSLPTLDALLTKGDTAVVLVEAFADGQHPVSHGNLVKVQQLCIAHGVTLVLDASRIVENAWYVQQHEIAKAATIAEIVAQFTARADLVQLDGAQAPKANVGALLATDDAQIFERLMNEVVVYEGLHTYGGMAGRTMEVLSRGLREMVDEHEASWVMLQTERFTERLRVADVPLERGCDGAYLRADQFLPQVQHHRQDTLSAVLYQVCGVRAIAPHRRHNDTLLPVQIPRLALTNDQLDQIADAIIHLYQQRAKVIGLQPIDTGRWRDELRYRAVFADLEPFEFDLAPWQIHTVEPVGTLDREGRQRAIAEAGYNTFLLRSADVAIDLLTDSGTTAMSTEQWAAYEAARATSSTSAEYQRLVRSLQELFGYAHIIPTHQGRAAEHILSQIMIGPDQAVPGNMYFTTTKLHQEMAGGRFVDVIVDEAHQPDSDFRWKGNVDLEKLAAVVDERGPKGVAYLSFELSVNMAGGQPVSMDNLREVYQYCSAQGIPVFFDATRVVENAYMIQAYDVRYARTQVRDILREMMLYGDGCTVSGKKDFLINMGGILAFREDSVLARRAQEMLRLNEGNPTDGGLSTADLAAMAQGVEEMVEDRYIRARVRQTERLGKRLMAAGIPIVTPPGSHAIFLDAKRFLPHVDQDAYPSQRLAAEMYVESGVRAMERGNVSKGRNPETGENYRPALELVRLTIPRRVYSDDHMEAVAQAVIRLWGRRHAIGGLKFVYEPTRLRFFQGRFLPLDA
jgi:tyrosine phenol-lyase